MRWEERLLAELDDLEGQAEGLHLAERDATVAELSISEYAEVDLMSRLHASVGCPVHLALVGGGQAEGEVSRVGRDWLLLTRERSETVVRVAAVLRVRGASSRSLPEPARAAVARLGLGSALRQLAAGRDEVAVTTIDGGVSRGHLLRVGADFVELAGDNGQVELVQVGVLVALRRV